MKSDYEVLFERILQELKAKPTALPRTVIFCKFIADVAKLYTYIFKLTWVENLPSLQELQKESLATVLTSKMVILTI